MERQAPPHSLPTADGSSGCIVWFLSQGLAQDALNHEILALAMGGQHVGLGMAELNELNLDDFFNFEES